MTEFGLIGYPLGHSFSKEYFLEKFKSEQLTHHFELFPIKEINEFPTLLRQFPELKGIAVTIPYKESVVPFLSAMTDAAAKIGAVNCISLSKGELKGFNTDVIGFEKSFSPGLKEHHKKALVLGTGGSSRAVQYVLDKLGIVYKLVSRNKTDTANTISYSEVNETLLKDFNIIINCTPVGMYPNETESPEIPYQFINADHYFFDLVYKPSETLFLKEGIRMGAQVKNGFEMLVLQAEENWKIWQANL